MNQSSNAVGIEEVADDELLQLLTSHLPIAILIDDLDIGGNVGSSGLEALVHGTVAIYQPFRHFDGLAYSVSIAVVRLYDLPE